MRNPAKALMGSGVEGEDSKGGERSIIGENQRREQEQSKVKVKVKVKEKNKNKESRKDQGSRSDETTIVSNFLSIGIHHTLAISHPIAGLAALARARATTYKLSYRSIELALPYQTTLPCIQAGSTGCARSRARHDLDPH